MPSTVWESFTKLGQDMVKCNICGIFLGYKGGSTSSMRRHLQGVHKMFETEIASPGQKSIKGFARKDDCSQLRSSKITSLIAEMIATDALPISMVETCSFHNLINYLEPGYKVPSYETMSDTIKNIYFIRKQKLKEELVEIEDVALTTDCWTSCTQEGYMTVTAHFVQDGKLQSKVLDTAPVETLRVDDGNMPDGSDQYHTVEAFSRQLANVTDDWNITQKICAVVHDNTSNTNNISVNANLNNACDIRCAAQTLHRSVKKGMAIAQVTSLVDAANRLVTYFTRSTIATKALEAKQTKLNLEKHSLIASMPTRWNSVFAMMECLLENRWAICVVLSDRKCTKLQDACLLELNDDSWKLMTEMVKCLKPLQVATTVLSADLYVNASVVHPVIRGLIQQHLILHNSDSTVIRDFKQTVARDLLDKFCGEAELTSIPMIASVLDPRFKSLKFVSDAQRQQVYEEVKRQLELLKQQEEPAPKKVKIAPTGLDFLLEFATEEADDSDEKPKDEFDAYIGLKKCDEGIDSNTNPVEWWSTKENSQKRFPVMAKLALKYMCIPATSFPSECVFTTNGNIVNSKWSSLKPENVNMFVFLSKLKKNDEMSKTHKH